MLNEVVREIIDSAATEQETDQRLTDADDGHAHPVDRSFEKDGLNQWCSVEPTHKRQIISDQNSLAYQERGKCGRDEPAEIDPVLFQDQLLGPQYQIKAYKEEDRRGQNMLDLCRPTTRADGAGCSSGRGRRQQSNSRLPPFNDSTLF